MSGSLQGAGGVSGLLSMRLHDLAKTLFFCYDGNGNVVRLIDISSYSKETVAQYTYDPFGRLIASSGTYMNYNDYLFSTKRYERQWGLHYYGYRFYSSDLGRWITRDPIGEQGGLNLYGFVGNGPVGLYDYLGLEKLGHTYAFFMESLEFDFENSTFEEEVKTLMDKLDGRYAFLTCHASQYNKKISKERKLRDLTEITSVIGVATWWYNQAMALLETRESPDTYNNGAGPSEEAFNKILDDTLRSLDHTAYFMCMDKDKCYDRVRYGIVPIPKKYYISYKKKANAYKNYGKKFPKYGKYYYIDCARVRSGEGKLIVETEEIKFGY